MKCLSPVLFSATCAVMAPLSANAQAAGPYTPEQVYSVFLEQIRQTMGIQPLDPNQNSWLSLSVVGTVVTTDDPAHLNDVANFCPPASPVIPTYGTEPRLDAVYEKVLLGAVTPLREYSPDYKKAKAFLVSSSGGATIPAAKYEELYTAYIRQWSRYYNAKNGGERTEALLEMNSAEKKWNEQGFRQEVEDAENVMAQEDFAVGTGRLAERRRALSAYRKAAPRALDIPTAYVSPASSMSPDPSKWDAATGWVKVSYAAKDTSSKYSLTTSKSQGFGGISLGFVTAVAKGGGGNKTETKVTSVYDFNYEFEVLRVTINRPWIDASVFFEPRQWTWRKVTNTPAYPLVATAREPATGRPVAANPTRYDNKEVGCALLPIEVLVARKRKLVATVLKSDYSAVQTATSASGGGSLFGIFGGGGGKSSSSTVITDNGNTVTFSLEADGIAVIGLISQIMPQSPNPNELDKWPTNAWLPNGK